VRTSWSEGCAGRGGAASPPRRLVLASRSPQRRALLRLLGIPFRVVVSGHGERHHHGRPAYTVEANARGKAEEVLARVRLRGDEMVLGVDTVVVLDGEVLGKPRDAGEAAAVLRRLAGRRHLVYSGLHLCDRERWVGGHAVTAVTFRDLDEAAVARYVASGEWRERAGGYAIQGLGAALVREVRGDYANVVGLPVALLLDALAALGAAPFSWLAAS